MIICGLLWTWEVSLCLPAPITLLRQRCDVSCVLAVILWAFMAWSTQHLSYTLPWETFWYVVLFLSSHILRLQPLKGTASISTWDPAIHFRVGNVHTCLPGTHDHAFLKSVGSYWKLILNNPLTCKSSVEIDLLLQEPVRLAKCSICNEKEGKCLHFSPYWVKDALLHNILVLNCSCFHRILYIYHSLKKVPPCFHSLPNCPQALQPRREDVLDQVSQLETESSIFFHHLNTLCTAAVSSIVTVKDSVMAAVS